MYRTTVFALLWALLIPLAAAPAAADSYVEGKDYVRLVDPVRPRNPAKIEVVEVFAYSCPHCYRFDPQVKAWKKGLPADVDFYYSPIVWNDLAQFHAQMFYTAKALFKLDRLHDSFFKAVHEQNNMLNTPDKVFPLFAAQGVTRAQFDRVFNSDAISAQVLQAKSRALGYRIDGTPEMVVAGKFRVGASMGGRSLSEHDAHARMLKVVDFLVEKERQTKKAAE